MENVNLREEHKNLREEHKGLRGRVLDLQRDESPRDRGKTNRREMLTFRKKQNSPSRG